MTATPTSTSTSTEPAVNQPDPANPSAPPALRMVDVRKVYGSGDGEVVALGGIVGPPQRQAAVAHRRTGHERGLGARAG